MSNDSLVVLFVPPPVSWLDCKQFPHLLQQLNEYFMVVGLLETKCKRQRVSPCASAFACSQRQGEQLEIVEIILSFDVVCLKAIRPHSNNDNPYLLSNVQLFIHHGLHLTVGFLHELAFVLALGI